MSVQMVFRSLQEVFPQVDLRILKAVAMEHSNDVDAAVEFVLSEVLPSLNESADACYAREDTGGRENFPADALGQDIFLGDQALEEHNANLPPESSVACAIDSLGDILTHTDSLSSPAICDSSNNSAVKEDESHHQPAEEPVSNTSRGDVNRRLLSTEDVEEQAASVQYIFQPFEALEGNGYAGLPADIQERYGAEAPSQNFPSLQEGMNFPIQSKQSYSKDLPSTDDLHAFSKFESYNSCPDNVASIQDVPPSVFDDTSNLDYGASSGRVNNNSLCNFKEQISRDISENSSKSVAIEIDATSLAAKPAVVTQFVQGEVMEILENSLSDAKSSKETLLLSFESVKNMMKEVELHETRARQGKEAAAKAGHDILAKAESMQEMLRHANETKEMQAAEVYGEKSVLASEARDLQSRLLNLSDQRERSLSVIEEIQQVLKMRVEAAKEAQASAEKEKLEKEEAARKVLKEQEVFMEEIVQESERLQCEAVENAKLKEFLMDRGCIIDALQGEMAVIFEDITSLKERVDGRVPLRSSLEATNSSLASSSSTSSALGSLSVTGESPEIATGKSLIENQLQADGRSNRGTDSGDVNEAFSDEDWELYT